MRQETNYSLLAHNTFGLAAKCSLFIEYNSETELQQAIATHAAAFREKHLHIGHGSNLLFTADYAGVILHSAIRGIEVLSTKGNDVVLRVGAGETWDDLVAYCVSHGYYGLENLSLIPGEVGAAAVQNIGAYGSEAGQFIKSVETIELATGQPRTFPTSACLYAYRDSIFKGEAKGQYAVTRVHFTLSTKFTPDLTYYALARELERRRLRPTDLTAAMLRQIVVEVRQSKLPDPAMIGNAGSFFINPVVSHEKLAQLQKDYPDVPHYEATNGVKLPAGWLIEHCGWKGRRVGKVGVYPKQALVLVNYGTAHGSDIVKLSENICRDVQDKFGVELRPEVNFV